jgi:phosphatidylserine decarboxylase
MICLPMTIAVSLFSLLPKKFLSKCWGLFMDIRYPAPIHRLAVFIFASITGADCKEAELEPWQYRSIGEFFVRRLKPGARPLGAGIQKGICPVDGHLRDVQKISGRSLLQVKGVTYSVGALVGSKELAAELEGGQSFNFYLSPKDYHRIHCPIDAGVESVTRVSGELWPVNNWSWANIPGLFTINERLVVELSTELGKVVMVLVGAYNVGRISTAFAWPASEPVMLKAGDHLGTFGMGSSVVLLYGAKGGEDLTPLRSEGAVRMGEDLFV